MFAFFAGHKSASFCRALWLCLLLDSLPVVNTSLAQQKPVEFEAEGVLDYIGYSEGQTTAISVRRSRFKVSVRDCLWRIRVEIERAPFDYVESGTDGINVYTLVSLMKHTEKVKREGQRIPENVGEAEIVPGNIPRETIHAPEIPFLWLAYASACYFETNHTDRLCSLEITGKHNPYSLRSTIPASWTVSKTHPGLPVRVVAMREGTIPYWDDPQYGPWVKAPALARFMPPYDQGCTNFIFQVGGHTNLGTIQIPTRADFQFFGQKSGGKSKDELSLGLAVTITLTNIRDTLNLDRLIPTVQGVTLCADYRFAFESSKVLGPIHYNFDEDWLSDQGLKERTEFKEQKMKNLKFYPLVGNSAQSPTIEAQLRIKWLVISASSLSCLLLWLLIRNKQKTKGNK